MAGSGRKEFCLAPGLVNETNGLDVKPHFNRTNWQNYARVPRLVEPS